MCVRVYCCAIRAERRYGTSLVISLAVPLATRALEYSVGCELSAAIWISASEYLKMEVVYIGTCVRACIFICMHVDTSYVGVWVYWGSYCAQQDSFSVLHVITLRVCRLWLANANLFCSIFSECGLDLERCRRHLTIRSSCHTSEYIRHYIF